MAGSHLQSEGSRRLALLVATREQSRGGKIRQVRVNYDLWLSLSAKTPKSRLYPFSLLSFYTDRGKPALVSTREVLGERNLPPDPKEAELRQQDSSTITAR